MGHIAQQRGQALLLLAADAHLTPVVASVRPTTAASFQRASADSRQ